MCSAICSRKSVNVQSMFSILHLSSRIMMKMIDVLRPLLYTWQAKQAERPPKVMNGIQRRNNFKICQHRDSNTGGSDLWYNTLPLDHGGAEFTDYNRSTITKSGVRLVQPKIPQLLSLVTGAGSLGSSCNYIIFLFQTDLPGGSVKANYVDR